MFIFTVLFLISSSLSFRANSIRITALIILVRALFGFCHVYVASVVFVSVIFRVGVTLRNSMSNARLQC